MVHDTRFFSECRILKKESGCTAQLHKYRDPEVSVVLASSPDVLLQFYAEVEADCALAIPSVKEKHLFGNQEHGHMVHNGSFWQQSEALHQYQVMRAEGSG